MEDLLDKEPIDRVDSRMKVTGSAKYAAEHLLDGLQYGVLVSSTIAKGTIISLDTKNAGYVPGVTSVITYLNCPKVPGYATETQQPKVDASNQPHRIFYDNKIYFNGQPIALVIADTFENATYAASLVKAKYDKQAFSTDFDKDIVKAVPPSDKQQASYLRGKANAYKTAEVNLEAEYFLPREVHNPMELHSIIATWEGDDKVMVYEKTQNVKGSQNAIAETFKLKPENVVVNAPFVGGGFGSALRTWPHSIAAIIGAKVIKKPLKIVLTRDQMFTMVGFRPQTIQTIGIGASKDGKLIGISHQSTGETSAYEEFTEGAVDVSKYLYNCPNVDTTYKLMRLNISTPTWMRGPGEATGAWALESAMDEMAFKLNIDPLQFRLINYSETDLEKSKPYSSKFLRECYDLGAEKIGWKNRKLAPGSIKDGDWLTGYGMSGGTFGVYQLKASVKAIFSADGKLTMQSGVSDSGPGTATSMTTIAAELLGIPPSQIEFQLGKSTFVEGPVQGGSFTTASLGSAVHDMALALKKKLIELAAQSNPSFKNIDLEHADFINGKLTSHDGASISYTEILQKANVPSIELTQTTEGAKEREKYSMYSFSVHFVEVKVHSRTGVVKVTKIVSAVDAGKIVNRKTAGSQILGGVVGGLGMALMEEGIIDNRYGRYVNNNFADYHVPVQADLPDIEVIFIDKPDPYSNPLGSKGLGEIALIGFAPAVGNAIFNATGKRIRALPITPDKLI